MNRRSAQPVRLAPRLTRSTLAVLLTSTGLVALGGCDEQAAQEDKNQQALVDATDKMSSRGSGYNVDLTKNKVSGNTSELVYVNANERDWEDLPPARRRELRELEERYKTTRDEGYTVTDPDEPYDPAAAKTAAELGLSRLYTQVALEAEDHRELERIFKDLEGPISSGTPAQKLSATRFRSKVVTDRAIQDITAARDAEVIIATANHDVLEQLGALHDYDALRRQALHDRTAVIDQLQTALDEKQAELADLQKKITDLDSEVTDLESTKESQTRAGTAALTRVEELNASSFEAEGERRYELQFQALEAQREANAAAYAREVAEAKLEVARQRLEPLQTRVDLIQTSLIEPLSKQLEDQRGLAETGRVEAGAVVQEQTAAADKLIASLDQLSNRYEQEVAAPIAVAYDAADRAVTQLETAAGGSPEQDVQRMLLDMHVAQLQAMATQARAAGGLGSTTRMVQQSLDAILPEHATHAGTILTAMEREVQDIEAKAASVNEKIEPLFQKIESAASGEQEKQTLAILRETVNSLTGQVALASGLPDGVPENAPPPQVAEPRTLVRSDAPRSAAPVPDTTEGAADAPADDSDSATPPADAPLGMPTEPAAQPDADDTDADADAGAGAGAGAGATIDPVPATPEMPDADDATAESGIAPDAEATPDTDDASEDPTTDATGF